MELKTILYLNVSQAAVLNSKMTSSKYRIIPEEELKAESEKEVRRKSFSEQKKSIISESPLQLEPHPNTAALLEKAVSRKRVTPENDLCQQFMDITQLIEENPVVQTLGDLKDKIEEVKADIVLGKIRTPVNLGIKLEEILVAALPKPTLLDRDKEMLIHLKETVSQRINEVIDRQNYVIGENEIGRLEELLSKFKKRKKKKNVESVEPHKQFVNG